MKLLVTGAGGYIGSVASYLFLQKGHEVVAVDNFVTGYRQPLELLKEKYGKSQFRWYEADLRSDRLSTILSQEKKIDAVVHYAASCLVDESMKNPSKYFENNVGGTSHLLSEMVVNSIPTIIFSSTCAVYGEAQYLPIDEKHILAPSTPYGSSKQMAEEVIQWQAKLKGIQYGILRYFNVCGASDDGLIGDSKKPSTLLFQNAVRGALGIEPFSLTFPSVDTPDKSPIRDYIHVMDLNEAHLAMLNYIKSKGLSDIVNLGTGTGSSVLEIVSTVKKITGKEFSVLSSKPRLGDDSRKVANIKKAEELLNWKPKRSLADSIQSLVTWYSAHPQGWIS